MAKDPAFLFYYQDFLVGTDHMTDEQIGQYVKCLCHQANRGTIREEHMKNICKTYENHMIIIEKFKKDQNGEYYNERLRLEVDRRKNYAESRRNNRIICKTYDKHMETETENENEDIKDHKSFKAYEDITITRWNEFCDQYPLISKVKSISGTRRKHLKQRFSEKEFDIVPILEALKEQPFLLDGNPNSKDHKNWRVSFDWLISNDTNYLKVLERKYKNADNTFGIFRTT